MSKTLLYQKPSLIICLILIQWFQAFNNPLKYIGYLASVILILLGALKAFTHEIKPRKSYIYISFFSIVIFMISNSIHIEFANFIYPFLLHVGLLSLGIGLYFSKIGPSEVKLFEKYLCPAFYAAIIFAILIYFLKGEHYLANDSYGATGLKMTFALSFFVLLKTHRKIITTLLISIGFAFIGERSATIILPFILCVYGILSLKKIQSSKIYYKCIFLLTFFFATLLPFAYVASQELDIGYEINTKTQEYTDANFYSGRNVIWEIIILHNIGKEWSGNGIGNDILSTEGETRSTHNLYMYLYMTGGLIFIFLFSLFMYFMWLKMRYYLYDKDVRFCAAFFIGLLFFYDFELILLGNNVPVSVMFWFIMNWGIMVINNKEQCLTKLTN